MISPYVRRLRLASELRTLRTEAGLTHEQLARQASLSRPQISRLENGHVVDQADILGILEALGVDGDRWTQIVTIAREAGEQGWWESTKRMGERPALYANLEAGATSIREYQQTFPPGLLQISDFVQARISADATLESMAGVSVDGVLAGNAGRQRMLRRPGGPTLEVVVDEIAIRRLSAPPEVVKQQLYHLASAVNSGPKINLRVLPTDTRVESFTVPRCTFSLYTYANGDPTVVAVDTVTSDVVLTEPNQVDPYDQLYARLRDAALLQDDSLDMITKTAATLSDDE